MADPGQDPTEVSADAVLRVRGDVEIPAGSNEATIASVPAGVAKIALHDEGVDEGDIHTLDALDGNTITAHASVTGNVGSLQYILSRGKTKLVPDTGVLSTTDWNDYDCIFFSGSLQTAEIQNIPQPLDPDGNVTGKELLLTCGSAVTEIVLRNNLGFPSNRRLNLPNFLDGSLFRSESLLLSYSPASLKWQAIAKNSVVVDSNGSGSAIVGQSIDFRGDVVSGGGVSVTHSLVARVARVTYSVDDLPLSRLADVADDTWIGNIEGSDGPPQEYTLTSLGGDGLAYNASTHQFDVGGGFKITAGASNLDWDGMEGRISGVDSGDFAGIDFTNSLGNVVFAAVTGAGGTFGVVGNVTNLPLSDLEDIQPGEALGLQIDAGSGPPVPLTGIEQGENIRFSNVQSITIDAGSYTSADFDGVTVDAIDPTTSTIHFSISTNADVTLHGFPPDEGKRYVFRKRGANGRLILAANSGTETTTANQFDGPNADDVILTRNNDSVVIERHFSRWRTINLLHPFFNSGDESDRDIIVHDGDEWVLENINTAITGAEVVQSESGSGDTDITLDADTTVLVVSFTADMNLRGISGADDSGRRVVVQLFRSSGSGTHVTVPHAAATPGGTSRIFNPDNEDIKLDHRDSFTIAARGNVWRVISVAASGFINSPNDSDRDIKIHDGDEWESENLATAAEPLDFTWTGEHVFESSIALDSVFNVSTATDLDDLDIGDANIVRINPTAGGVDLSGMVAAKDGHFVWIVNSTTSDDVIGITHEDTNSSAANRISLRVTTLFVQRRSMVAAWYDGAISRWRTDL